MKKNKLTDNLFLRIMAVIVAILVWIIVVNVSDPIIESSYSGVQVEILNPDIIAKNNQTYDVLNGTNTISVTVTAKRSINDLLGKENIKATADMAELDEKNGTVRIRLETNKYNDKIESIKSKTEVLEVKIEDLMKRQLSITPVINGEPVEGYVKGDVTLEQNVVTVQGPESVVSQIDHATAEASIAGMSGSISTTSTIRYYDADDEQLDASRLSGNITSVSIKVEVLATKTLSIKFGTTGTPAADYGISGEVTADIDEVLVAGRTSTLVSLSAITIPNAAVDVSGKSESFDIELDLEKYLPDNVRLAQEDFDGMVTLHVPIGQMAVKSVAIPRSSITFMGLDTEEQRGTIVDGADSFTFEFKGMPADLEGFGAENVKAVLAVDAYMESRNMTSIKAGTYKIPIRFELPDGVYAVSEGLTVECRIRDIN